MTFLVRIIPLILASGAALLSLAWLMPDNVYGHLFRANWNPLVPLVAWHIMVFFWHGMQILMGFSLLFGLGGVLVLMWQIYVPPAEGERSSQNWKNILLVDVLRRTGHDRTVWSKQRWWHSVVLAVWITGMLLFSSTPEPWMSPGEIPAPHFLAIFVLGLAAVYVVPFVGLIALPLFYADVRRNFGDRTVNEPHR